MYVLKPEFKHLNGKHKSPISDTTYARLSDMEKKLYEEQIDPRNVSLPASEADNNITNSVF